MAQAIYIPTPSYVDDLLRRYLALIATDGTQNACARFDLVETAYALMLRGSAQHAKYIRQKFEVYFPNLDLGILDAMPYRLWPEVVRQLCVDDLVKLCESEKGKYVSFCLADETGHKISNPLEKVVPYCCRMVAEVIIEFADERGFAKLALIER